MATADASCDGTVRWLRIRRQDLPQPHGHLTPDHRHRLVGAAVLRPAPMKEVLPCAVYTRKSSEEGLEQGFNSLDAQREACEAFILSQKEQGWKPLASS